MSAVVKWAFEDYWASQSQDYTHYFYYTGAPVDFTVPDGVTEIRATIVGAAGGGENLDSVCSGGTMVGLFPVTPGENLRLRVGGNADRPALPVPTSGVTGGYNGGGNGGDSAVSPHSAGYGGGGATDIRQGGDALANRVLVAGGGGGNSGEDISAGGGPGGGLTGGNGTSLFGTAAQPYAYNYFGGNGGTQSGGGASPPGGGGAGSLGVGGNGANNTVANGGGGGGGGLYGGSGGGVSDSGVSAVNQRAGGGAGGSNGAAAGVTVISNLQGAFVADPEPPVIVLQYISPIGNPEPTVPSRYVMAVNPNDGGSPTIQKNILMSQTVGPNRVNILQEGTSQAPVIAFSGVVLTQGQLEAMEKWFDRRVFIKLTDDLGREFYGVFSKWTPKRQRRASNFWYHTYDAEFTVSGYKNASGEWVYGRVA